MILKQYKNYKYIFKELGIYKALLEYKLQNYKIILKKGKILIYIPIYSISVNKLKRFREYIDNNLAKK